MDISEFVQLLENVRQTGESQWLATCPCHDDERPSLSVALGDDGRVLVRCHAGCRSEEIVTSLGLTMGDLFSRQSAQPRNIREIAGLCKPASKSPRSYRTAREAADALRAKYGRESCQWAYGNAQGELVGGVMRWDLPDGCKEIRPISRHGDGWRIAAMPSLRLLYRLPALLESEGQVYVVEGEKCADALVELGLVATTSSGGSGAAGKSDWSPLAGRDVVLLPDADVPGRKYANQVAAILRKVSPPAMPRILELPDLAEGEDVVNFIERKCTEQLGTDAIRAELERLADTANASNRAPPVEEFRPFPVEVLPEPLRSFVQVASRSIGCDSCYVALPLLAAVAGAIGLSRALRLKRGWVEHSVIWAAIVGESATMKTPAFNAALRPLRDRQGQALQRQVEAMRNYESEYERYVRDLQDWKKSKQDTDPPTKPAEPVAQRCLVQDTTIEALAALLMENQRGLLTACDELSAWLGGFDKYRSARNAGDAANWLSAWSAGHLIVDRKTGDRKTIFVPRGAISVCGGIQPRILDQALAKEHRENGLLARLLLAAPPQSPRRWTEQGIPEKVDQSLADLFDRVYEHLQPDADENGNPRPIVLKFTADGKQTWLRFFRENARHIDTAEGELRAALAKLEAYGARLALLVHCVRLVDGDSTLADPARVDAQSMSVAATLIEWFRHEVRRVYAMIRETDEQRFQRRLAEWICRRGGRMTARELLTGRKDVETALAAERLLRQLIEAGYGEWQPVPTTKKGGRPTQRFVLFDRKTVCTTPVNSEEHEVVQTADRDDDINGDHLADEQDQEDEADWGEIG